MRNCVYRFFNKEDEVIYVGRTSQGVEKRIKEHFSSQGHLDPVCYKDVQKVDYCSFQTIAETKIYELYLINLYKPKYNTADKEHKTLKLKINVSKLKWEDYDFTTKEEKEKDDNEKLIQRLREELKKEKEKRRSAENENKKLSDMNVYLEKLLNEVNEQKNIEYDAIKTKKINMGINNRDVERIIAKPEFSHLIFASEYKYNGEVTERVEIKNIDGKATYLFTKSGICFPATYLNLVSMDVVNKQLILSKMDAYSPINASDKEISEIEEYIEKETMKYVS
ncbi:MAG: GIY-YIG nuclease family protein [Bacillaceae bacterium]